MRIGFALIAAGLLLGSGMSTGSSEGSIAAWMAVLGAGMGLAMATSSSAALSELSEEHSGVGSAVLQAVNKTGGPFGAAMLGSVLSSAYLARPRARRSAAGAARAARERSSAAVAVAGRLHSPALLHSARTAFVQGIDQALLVSAAIAARRRAAGHTVPAGRAPHGQDVRHTRVRTLLDIRDQPPVGLRERKKAKTRAAIQVHALRLFARQGYAATTVDQIAEAAEVSPSTFFRYFPTKEDVVLHDRYDPLLLAAFRAQPPELSPIAALRRTIRSVLGSLPADELARERQRATLVIAVPELRARALDQLASTLEPFTAVVAERTGRSPRDPAVRALTGAIIGVSMSAMLDAAEDPGADYVELMDTGLAHLQAGLPV